MAPGPYYYSPPQCFDHSQAPRRSAPAARQPTQNLIGDCPRRFRNIAGRVFSAPLFPISTASSPGAVSDLRGVHQSLIHTDAGPRRRTTAMGPHCTHAAGQAPGQPVGIANGQHRQPRLPPGRKAQIITGPLSRLQHLNLGDTGLKGKHRRQGSGAGHRVGSTAQHTVQRNTGTGIITPISG